MRSNWMLLPPLRLEYIDWIPMMVIVGTASNAYTMNTGRPASVPGKKSPNPMVRKNV
jgi:hypothetical protein